MDQVGSVSIKVQRQVPGTRQMELVWDGPLMDWRAEETARAFGPGAYIVTAGPGSWKGRYASLRVSEDLARAKGWGRMEPAAPLPSQIAGMGFAQRAAQETGTQGIGLVIESVMRPVLDELRALRMERTQPQAPAGGGMMEALTVLGTLQNQAQGQSMQFVNILAQVMQGKTPMMPGNDDEDEHGDMISKATAGLGEGLGKALLGSFMNPHQPQRPTMPPRMPPSPPVRPVLPLNPQPTPEPTLPNPSQHSPVPNDIRAALEPMAADLRQVVPFLGMMTRGLDPAGAADLLDEKIDTQETAEGVVLLADQIRQHGPEAMRWIHADLATPYWAETVGLLGQKIARAMMNDTEDGAGELEN